MTQSPLDVLTNNPSTHRVNGPQNVVPVNTNMTRGNTHSNRVEGTPVMGGPSLKNVAQNLQTQVEDDGLNVATCIDSHGNNDRIFLPIQLNTA